ncbi:MAG: adenosylcobinamide-GDP ribazoletransferase, partial [Elusimicrobia bacterium]|nr:adenosylcobinamide-GDP ribazoletransferase [Elusimicrobiota bacterium]
SRDEALRIMSSGNIGPFAMFAGVIYLAIKLYLAVKIAPPLFLPVFVLSRWGMSFSAAISKPAKNRGMCTQITFGNTKYIILSSLYLPFLFFFANSFLLAGSIALLSVINFVIVKLIERKIGGLTGDSFGLINEIDELTVMLVIFLSRGIQ